MALGHMLWRFAGILWVLLSGATVYGVRRLAALGAGEDARERLRGEALADMLERLGATFIKFGQILSTRPDILGPGLIEPLSRLQDRVPSEPFAEVRGVLEREGLLSAFEMVEPEPLAAASVAQVHRAHLPSGEQVAVKVQRRGASAQIEQDLTLLRFFARALELLPSIKLLSLSGAVERFGRAMADQLDFRREAANNLRFASNFEAVTGVDVPRLHEDLCTGRVLTMELIEGVRATDPEKVGGNKKELARRGLDAVLKMVFTDAFVHADLHPGNILLTNDGRLVLIDLGLIAEIEDEMKRPWVDTFVALSQQNGREAARLFYIYAPTVGDCDYEAYERAVVDHFDGFAGLTMAEIESSAIVGGVMDILRRHRVQIDPVFTVVHVAIVVAEGLGKQLDPDIDIVTLATPYVMAAAASAPPGRPPYREVPDRAMPARPTAPGAAA